jgi:hypothetical protein
MKFLSKKGKDFKDFKIISQVLYNGAHRKEEIRSLVLKLSNTMNNFRLSTSPLASRLYPSEAPPSGEKRGGLEDKRTGVVQSLTYEEINFLLNATPTIERLIDGRVRDINTKKILPKLNSCVFEILGVAGEYFLANSLTEAASIVNLYPDTLGKYLDSEGFKLEGAFVDVKNYKVRRVAIFSGSFH